MIPEQASSASEGSDLKSPHQWLGLLAIVFIGLALRLYHIGHHGLFVDEIYSVLVATNTGDPELMQFDAIRPIYFLLLKAWLSFASDETWMRLLSVVFGVFNIALIYQLGKMFSGRKVAYAAAVLTALSPMEIHYSQQVRMYTMGTFLVLLGTIALLKAFETEKKKPVLAWAATRLLMVLTLPLTGILLLVDGLYAFDQRKKTTLLPLVGLCAAALVVLWAPFIFLVPHAHQSPYDYWRASLDAPNFVDLLTLLINFTATATPLQEGGGPPVYDWFSVAYILVFLATLGLAIAFCHRQAKMLWCCAYALIPLTILFTWSNIDYTVLLTRYSLFTAPFVMILLAFGWAQAWLLWRPAGFGIAAVYGLAMITYLGYFYSHAVHEDWRPVAQFITAHEKPGDQIVVWNYHSKYFFNYYYHGHNQISDLLVRKLGEDGKETDGEIKSALLQFEFVPKPGQRIWLISKQAAPGWARMYKAYCLFQQALDKHYNILRHEDMAMTDIYEVTAK
jgi:mannosyltransferase